MVGTVERRITGWCVWSYIAKSVSFFVIKYLCFLKEVLRLIYQALTLQSTIFAISLQAGLHIT